MSIPQLRNWGSRYYYSHLVLIALVRGNESGQEENCCANSMSSKAVWTTVAANNLQNTPEWMTWVSSKPGSKSKLEQSLFIFVTNTKPRSVTEWATGKQPSKWSSHMTLSKPHLLSPGSITPLNQKQRTYSSHRGGWDVHRSKSTTEAIVQSRVC